MKRLKRLNESNENIIPTENKVKLLKDLFEHKTLIIKYCTLVSKHLILNGRDEEALELMKRGFAHDESKLSDEEFYGMSKIIDELGGPNKKSDEAKRIVQIHKDKNKHHPEYWDNILEMEDIDIMELAIDWSARSEQFDNDAIEFLIREQKEKFNFPQEIYDKIESNLLLIKDLRKKER